MHAFVRGVVSIGFAGTNRSEIEEQEEALLKKGEHLEDVPPDMTRMERLHHYAELNLYTECEMLVFRKHSQRYVHFAKDSGKASLYLHHVPDHNI